MGHVQDQTYFHVINANVTCHILTRLKFLYTYNIIPSSCHQWIKRYWKGKKIIIPATKAPFECSFSKIQLKMEKLLLFDLLGFHYKNGKIMWRREVVKERRRNNEEKESKRIQVQVMLWRRNFRIQGLVHTL